MKISYILLFILCSSMLFAQTPINSYVAFQGYDETTAHFGEGEYQIFLDTNSGVLDRPLLIVDSFDPADNNDITDMYSYMSYGNPEKNYFDELRAQGVDIIILNFPTYTRSSDGETINGGADFIERNGLILVNLIEFINNTKVGTEELVVVGPSMGGLITQYALSYMEQNSLDHQAGLWVSFDAPHRGSNTPISFQYAINFLAVQAADASMLELRDTQLNSPAAKQMLLDHYIPHLQSGSEYLQDTNIQLPVPHSFRNTFVSIMNTLGFPTQTRNLAVVNGSLNAAMNETPGATIFNFVLDSGTGLGVDWHLKFTPEAGITGYEIDYIQPVIIGSGAPVGAAFYAYAESPANSASIDSAPGGNVEFVNFFGSNPTGIQQQIIDALEIEVFCFIPTLSALAIEEDNWYNSIDGTETTPFDSYIAQNTNEQHLTFSQGYVDFLDAEITAFFSLGTAESQLSSAVKLLGNPVQERLAFSVDNSYKDLTIKIASSTGQIITTHKIVNNKPTISIPSPSENGLYFLYISNENTQTVKKFIVNR